MREAKAILLAASLLAICESALHSDHLSDLSRGRRFIEVGKTFDCFYSRMTALSVRELVDAAAMIGLDGYTLALRYGSPEAFMSASLWTPTYGPPSNASVKALIVIVDDLFALAGAPEGWK